MIRSLVSYPCKISARAILSSLEIKLNDDIKSEMWRDYVARGLKMLTINTSGAETAQYLTIDFVEAIRPQTQEPEQTAEEVIDRIVNGINGGE